MKKKYLESILYDNMFNSSVHIHKDIQYACIFHSVHRTWKKRNPFGPCRFLSFLHPDRRG